MTKSCHEDAKESDSGISPCLLDEGHKGRHIHYKICNIRSCMCNGFMDRWHSGDKMLLEVLEQKKYQIQLEIDSLERKYRRFH